VRREPVVRTGKDRRPPGEGVDTPEQGGASIPSEEPASDLGKAWSFSDWRLQASLSVDDVFSYRLRQQFDAILVEGAKGQSVATYLRVWELDENGDRIEPPLRLENFSVVRRRKLLSHFRGVNPKLEIALVGSTPILNAKFQIAPEIALSLMSYGDTEDDLRWRFIRVGLSFDGSTVGISASPASYNLGKELPLVSNVWLSPIYIWNEGHGLGMALGGTL